MNFPILSSLILLPTIGALFLFFTKDKEGNNSTAKYVSLFYNRLLDIGGNPLEVLKNTRTNFDRNSIDSEIIVKHEV